MSQPAPGKPSTGKKPTVIPQARRIEERPAAAPPMIAVPVKSAPVTRAPAKGAPAKSAPIQGVQVHTSGVKVGPPAGAGEWSGPAAAPAGSIAQKVRRKTIAEAMWLLLLCGVANVVWGGVMWVHDQNALNTIFKSMGFAQKGAQQQAMDSAIFLVKAVWGTQILVGAIFVLLAATVNRAPLRNTSLALFLYVAMIVGLAVFAPVTIFVGIVGKVLLTAALAGAVATAYRFERAKKQMAAAAAR